jgi:plasmid stabilization system protein ParE
MDALFDAASSRLEMFPRVGREVEIPGTRELIPHRRYRLVYEIRDNEIVIVTLVHTSRRWPPAVEDES